MRLKFATISVKDIDESLKFYTEILKLKKVKSFIPREGISVAFVQDDYNNEIELLENKPEKPNFKCDAFAVTTLNFRVDNLQETINFLTEKGIAIKRGPRESGTMDKPFARFVVIDEPNGLEIAFHEHLNAN